METINQHLPELISFYHVAKKGGFTAAANELSLSKAQLSKHVLRLETVLSVELFIRTTRKIVLTQEGQMLLSYADQIMNVGHEAFDVMKGMSQKEGGRIKITAPSSLGDWFAPLFLKVIREKYPLLKLEFDLTNVRRNIVNDQIDFALRAMDENDPSLIARYLGHIHDVICVSPKYLKHAKSLKQSVDPKDLMNEHCLMSSLQSAWNTWKLQKGNKDLVIEVRGNYASTSYYTSKLLCLEGLGVARVPLYLVQKEIEEGQLVQLYSDYVIATHPLYLVYPQRSYRSKMQKEMRDLILSWFKQNKYILS